MTVVLPHYRCEAYLADAVRSILEQTWRDLELVVVDDASPSDRWLEVLRTFRKDVRLKAMRTSRNVGPYRIINRVVAETDSALVAFQDADDISSADRLEKQARALDRRRLDVVGTGFLRIDEAGSVLEKKPMPRWPLFWGVLGMDFVVHPVTVLCRRAVIDVLGGFDGTTYFEADTDFLIRAQFAFRIGNVRRCLYSYRARTDSISAAADTGIGSPAREAYRRKMFERREALRAISDPAALRSALRAPSNDVAFTLEEIRL